MLTDAACKAATCPPDKARARFPDAGGLYLEVSPAGSKRWFLKYRKDGKEMRLALGSYPDVRLADVRAKQAEAKALKRKGVDPIHAKQVAKLQSTAQADDNFEAVARDWHSKQISNWSEGHAKTVIRRLERDLFPWIGKRSMAQLHAMELLAALQKGRITAGRRINDNMARYAARALIKRMLQNGIDVARSKVGVMRFSWCQLYS